jgi:hypothetical protein
MSIAYLSDAISVTARTYHCKAEIYFKNIKNWVNCVTLMQYFRTVLTPKTDGKLTHFICYIFNSSRFRMKNHAITNSACSVLQLWPRHVKLLWNTNIEGAEVIRTATMLEV